MKKPLMRLSIILVSLLITFITFETMSWYHFGDIPTQIVLIRLILFFVLIVVILIGIIFIIRKLNKK